MFCISYLHYYRFCWQYFCVAVIFTGSISVMHEGCDHLLYIIPFFAVIFIGSISVMHEGCDYVLYIIPSLLSFSLAVFL